MTIQDLCDQAEAVVRLLQDLREEQPENERLFLALKRAAPIVEVLRYWKAYAPRVGELACVRVEREVRERSGE